MRATLIYPHQLFDPLPFREEADRVILVEEPLFFRQYHFHAKKLILHRASMKQYAKRLKQSGVKVEYIDCGQLEDTEDIARHLVAKKIDQVTLLDPCDDWLERRLDRAFAKCGIEKRVVLTPGFLTSLDDWKKWADQRKRLYFTDFYIHQRIRLGIMVDESSKPVGGKWSFDPENRKKLPAGLEVPEVPRFVADSHVKEAIKYVLDRFPNAIGDVSEFEYATTHEQAKQLLDDFLDQRFANFGDYEDAIDTHEGILFHSVLTPALNIGLLTPEQVIHAALKIEHVPLNSMEGFIRQVLGWREFVRGVYVEQGRSQRTANFWQHSRKIPASFYTGETGVLPVDTVIRRVLKTGYCHHIERLMVIGNFMLLCEFDPDQVYQWFMELFIDAYDWVMVPNVYGMSMYADGGKMTTKPYISGSNYLRKMSNFPKGEWCEVWDGLYWRFIAKHRDFFGSNPRMSVMTSQLNRMGSKLDGHIRIADTFLEKLDR